MHHHTNGDGPLPRGDADEAAEDRVGLRLQARRLLGQHHQGEAIEGEAVPGALPAVAVLGAITDVHLLLLLVLTSDIAHSIGTSTTAIRFAAFLQVVFAPLLALAFLRLASRRWRWDLTVLVGGTATVVTLGATSLATSGGQVLLLALLGAAAAAPALALHTPLVVESQPGPDRAGAVAAYWASRLAGAAVALLVGAGLVAGTGLTWRGVFAVVTILALVAVAFAAVRAPFAPPAGTFDEHPIRDLVTGARAGGDQARADLGLFETVRRLLLVPSVKRLVGAAAALGAFAAPFVVFTLSSLTRGWVLSLGEQLGVAGAIWGVGAAGVAWSWVEIRRIRHAQALRLLPLTTGTVLVGAVAVLFAAFVDMLPLWAMLLGAGVALIGATSAALHNTVLTLLESYARPTAAVMLALLSGSVGGLAGLLLLGGVDRRFGLGGGIAATALVALVLGAMLRRITSTVDDDVDRLIDEVVEQEKLQQRRQRGEHIPMLNCRGIDFSYDQLQVLFDVDFTVDEGEMVALLGTNGAGKSTLLKVISGLGLPSRGSVHFHGQDITYLDAERRLDRGIAQIPGGKAVFPPLSVIENLRVFGHALGHDRDAVDRGIEATLEAFPRLDERRNQLASTLSGGEQQMLALGKAFIIQPQLLLIDELSLGLAPIIVSDLLQMVRRINDEGTAVVLVEQSVNVALSLVDHAYFMEKGEIKFDGPAEELLDRRDLLRSVFLEGAAQGLE